MCSCLFRFEINGSLLRLLSASMEEKQPFSFSSSFFLRSNNHVTLSSGEASYGRARGSLSVLSQCSCLLLYALASQAMLGCSSGHARDSLAHEEIRQFSLTQIEWLQPQVPIKEIYCVFKKTRILIWLVQRYTDSLLSTEPFMDH